MSHPPTNASCSTGHRAAALRRAALRAAQAPSVLDTQPWKLRIRGGALHVHADLRRQLAALDPQRRVLTASVGCAVFNARASLAADGYDVLVRRFPNPLVADLFATLEFDPARRAQAAPYPGGDLVASLESAVAAEGVRLHVLDEQQRQRVSELNAQADAIENLDPTYRAELDAWTSPDGGGRKRVVLPSECLAVLETDDDAPVDWLRVGEAMMAAREVAAANGATIVPSTQVIEVSSARAQLRRALGLSGYPHMLLRAGHASARVGPRRRLVDVLVEES